MKIFEEEESLKDIDPFLDKGRFPPKLNIDPYECGGICYVEFHDLVLFLAKLYFLKIKKCRINEQMIQTVVEVKSKRVLRL